MRETKVEDTRFWNPSRVAEGLGFMNAATNPSPYMKVVGLYIAE